MDVNILARTNDVTAPAVVLALINLMEKGLVMPVDGTTASALTGLRAGTFSGEVVLTEQGQTLLRWIHDEKVH